jgi:hypothetical protein
MLTNEAWRLKMEPWRVYRPVVADHYDKSRIQIRTRRKVLSCIRIRMKVMRIRIQHITFLYKIQFYRIHKLFASVANLPDRKLESEPDPAATLQHILYPAMNINPYGIQN